MLIKTILSILSILFSLMMIYITQINFKKNPTKIPPKKFSKTVVNSVAVTHLKY